MEKFLAGMGQVGGGGVGMGSALGCFVILGPRWDVKNFCEK